MRLASLYYDTGLVFPNQAGKTMNVKNLTARSYKPLLKRTGLPKTVRLHDLRHTCATVILSRGVRPKHPTDRGKPGSKRHVVSDRKGVPLAVVLTAANVHESKVLEEAVDTIGPIRRPAGKPGRARKRPEKLHADKGYDFPRCREALRKRGIKSRIARRGVESSERLGRHRWVVERTLSWLNRFRRLKVRYERRADVHQAFLELGCALICWNHVQRFC